MSPGGVEQEVHIDGFVFGRIAEGPVIVRAALDFDPIHVHGECVVFFIDPGPDVILGPVERLDSLLFHRRTPPAIIDCIFRGAGDGVRVPVTPVVICIAPAVVVPEAFDEVMLRALSLAVPFPLVARGPERKPVVGWGDIPHPRLPHDVAAQQGAAVRQPPLGHKRAVSGVMVPDLDFRNFPDWDQERPQRVRQEFSYRWGVLAFGGLASCGVL